MILISNWRRDILDNQMFLMLDFLPRIPAAIARLSLIRSWAAMYSPNAPYYSRPWKADITYSVSLQTARYDVSYSGSLHQVNM